MFVVEDKLTSQVLHLGLVAVCAVHGDQFLVVTVQMRLNYRDAVLSLIVKRNLTAIAGAPMLQGNPIRTRICRHRPGATGTGRDCELSVGQLQSVVVCCRRRERFAQRLPER